jgi:hypothetical protein
MGLSYESNYIVIYISQRYWFKWSYSEPCGDLLAALVKPQGLAAGEASSKVDVPL